MHRLLRIVALAATMGALGSVGAEAQVPDWISIHGFATQAYAATSDMPMYGIPTGGTADMRASALQFRVIPARWGQAVVQFSHRRLGGSPLAALEETAEIDWAYYQHRLGNFSARVGRFPMARGMFNEIRDVGVVLPFYRASYTVYGEGVETADGARVDYSLGLGAWEIESMAYYGDVEIKTTATLADGLQAVEANWIHTYGSQVIVNTPIQGVRFGFTAMRATQESADPSANDAYMVTASADGSFERFFVRGEYEIVHAEGQVDFVAYYGQAGVKVVGGLWVNTQAEWNTNTLLVPGPANGMEIKAVRDYALGVSYAVTPKLVFKLEGHSFEGLQFDVPVNPFGAAMGNKYFITSVSTAF